jgi:hypothetical protein
MKNIVKKSWAIIIGVVVLVSCTKDFEKINTNNNAPSVEKAAPNMLLTNAIEVMTDRLNETFFGEEMGNCWVQHEAKVQYTDEDRYIPRVAVINNTWSSFYASSGEDIASLYKIGVDRALPNYQGIALVLKAYVTAVLTDTFGDIPYTEAWRAAVADGGIISPKYDSQQSVYTDLIAKLDEANTLIDPAGLPIGGDILYGNDLLKWKKFANTLRMRLILRMSDRDAAFATSELTKMFGDPGTYPVFESNDDDAQLNYLASAPNNNPRNENRKTRDDHRVSKTVTDLMWTNSPYVDWRICIFAEYSGNNTFEGIPNGLTSAKALAYNGNGLKYTSKIGKYFTDVINGATAPGVLMSYSELLFIKAEAGVKGFIPSTDADDSAAYIEAIHANYNHYGQALVDAEEAKFGLGATDASQLAQDFIDNENHGWNAANAMDLIAEEKWVTLFDQGVEAWAEWRRLDFPALVPAEDGALNGEMPVRVYYPSDEAARNQTNWKAAKTAQSLSGDADMLTRVWWDTK